MDSYDVIVIGNGHCACEAALASSRIAKTALLSEDIDSLAPIRDVDDFVKTVTDKILDKLKNDHAAMPLILESATPRKENGHYNLDPLIYHRKMKHLIERTRNLDLIQDKAVRLIGLPGTITGVSTMFGKILPCLAVAVCVEDLAIENNCPKKDSGVFYIDPRPARPDPLKEALSGVALGVRASEYAVYDGRHRSG